MSYGTRGCMLGVVRSSRTADLQVQRDYDEIIVRCSQVLGLAIQAFFCVVSL